MENLTAQINQIFSFISSYTSLTVLVYVILSFLTASIVDGIIIGIVKKIVSNTKTDLDNFLLDIFHKPIYYTILYAGFYLTVSVIEFSDKINLILFGIIKTVIVFYWISSFFKALNVIIKFDYKDSRVNSVITKKTAPLFDNLGKILIFLIGIYLFMISWGIDVTAIVASAGILSVAIGFAAKDTLGNLFSGIFIMADSPYKEGDYINLDTGERGYVTSIGLRSTRVLTRDDIEITIPNSVIANSKIVNESGGPYEKERVRINVSVAYGSDLEKVKNLLNEIASEASNVSNDPKPRVRLRALGDSGLNIQLLFWVEKPELRGLVVDEVTSTIYNTFNNEKIVIPFPQRTLHIKKES